MSARACKYYINGNCRFGDRCRFSHVSKDYFEIDVSDSSEDESTYIPSRRFVYFKSEGDGKGVPGHVPHREKKHELSNGGQAVRLEQQRGLDRYGFSADGQALRLEQRCGLDRYGLSDDGSRVRHEPQRRRGNYGFSDDVRCNSPTSSHRYKGSSRFSDLQPQEYEPEEDLEEGDSSYEVREIVDKIQQEAQLIQYKNMWPLTSLSLLKDGTKVPGWVDHSPEELRMAAYSAKLSSSLDEYYKSYKYLMQNAKENRDTFLYPTEKAEKIVWDMLNQGKDGHQHTNFTLTSVPAFCAFGSTSSSPFVSPGTLMVFGGVTSTSSMGSASNNIPTVSIFGYKLENDPAPGIFSMAASQLSSKDSGSDCKMDIPSVASAGWSTPTISSHIGNSPLFMENLFGQVPLRSPPKDRTSSKSVGTFVPTVRTHILRHTAQTSSSKTDSIARDARDDGIYTPMDQLSQSDLEQFLAATFTLDKLPLVPPPKELC